MAEQTPAQKLYHDIMDVFIYLQRRDVISVDELDECRELATILTRRLRIASERLAADEATAERRRIDA